MTARGDCRGTYEMIPSRAEDDFEAWLHDHYIKTLRSDCLLYTVLLVLLDPGARPARPWCSSCSTLVFVLLDPGVRPARPWCSSCLTLVQRYARQERAYVRLFNGAEPLNA